MGELSDAAEMTTNASAGFINCTDPGMKLIDTPPDVVTFKVLGESPFEIVALNNLSVDVNVIPGVAYFGERPQLAVAKPPLDRWTVNKRGLVHVPGVVDTGPVTLLVLGHEMDQPFSPVDVAPATNLCVVYVSGGKIPLMVCWPG